MKNLLGTGVALVTPFNPDLSIDIGALKRIVNFCIEGNVDYLVILGTTGESATLTSAEKQIVIDVVVQENAGRLPLVIGIGGNNTKLVTEEIQQTNLKDFVAVLSVSPYYNKPTQEGIYRHYKTLAQASEKPVILYNVPGRTGSNIEPETVLRLARDCSNIVGIKEASGDMIQLKKLINILPPDFLVISGDDFTALPTVLEGGVGVISVLGQGLPNEFSRMIKLGLQGEEKEAYALHNSMLGGMRLSFQEGNPAGIKSVLQVQGLCGPTVRLPLVEASPKLKIHIEEFLRTISKINA
ncbi:4-hydroxy-tetrahydrodipicolinate synthase [uncultured Eudoraea sp.]|uniref:4-hydroxy-tetrahydrodipicolinate synthase n=1 Tax=uncultured Eudoraea sp. TaxID=1035614 RepID=UPI0026281FD8|nr:4-hydroxy-tetrahydrodipicolinate synthase [uncultured Eudoraea sp.]